MRISPVSKTDNNSNKAIELQTEVINKQNKNEFNKEVKGKEKGFAEWNKDKSSIKLEKIEEMVVVANEVMKVMDKGLEFSVHEGTARTIVRVIDRVENKVIKEIPSEKMLDLIAKIWELVGLFVDEKI